MSTRRPVRRVDPDAQLSLLERPAAISKRTPPTSVFPSESPRFVDQDPEALWFGTGSLRHYLETMKMHWVFEVRTLLGELDWKPFIVRYKGGGRPSYAPRAMVGIIIYGILSGRSSLRQLEQMARLDVACHWLSGGLCPDHASLGRFIHRHRGELAGPFFEQVTLAVLRRLPEISTEVSTDGTVLEAAASRFKAVDLEAAEAMERAAEDFEDDDPRKGHAQKVAETARERVELRKEGRYKTSTVRVNLTDVDSVLLKTKSNLFRFGYVSSVSANAQRVIVGLDVDPRNELGGLDAQLEMSTRLLGQPTRWMLDSNYFCSHTLNLALAHDLDLLCPAPEQSPTAKKKKKKKAKRFPKTDFRYLPDEDALFCPAGQLLRPKSRGIDKDSGEPYHMYETKACNEGCRLREQCTTSERGRRIQRLESDEPKDLMRNIMEHPAAKKAYGKRQASVEPVFSELRGVQGLHRFRRRGLDAIRVEFALHCTAYNVRRLLSLMSRGEARASVETLFMLMGTRIAWLLSWMKQKRGSTGLAWT